MSNNCIYYVEGPCEQQLINALKMPPSYIMPGKVKSYNVIQKLIPKSEMLGIKPGAIVVFVFDTDVSETKFLIKNIELLKKYCSKVKIVYLAQVLNFEDELVRCTDVKHVIELTQSKSVANFKTDFCRIKTDACRVMLERHGIKVNKLWTTSTKDEFGFVKQNGKLIRNL